MILEILNWARGRAKTNWPMRRLNFKFSWGSILPLYSLSVTIFLQLDPIRLTSGERHREQISGEQKSCSLKCSAQLFQFVRLSFSWCSYLSGKKWFPCCRPQFGNVFFMIIYMYLWLRWVFYYWCVMNESPLIGRTMSHCGEKGKISLFLWVSLNGDVSSNVEMRIFLIFLFSVKGENQLCARRGKQKEIKKLEKNSKNELDIIRVGASKVNFSIWKFRFFEKCTLE